MKKRCFTLFLVFSILLTLALPAAGAGGGVSVVLGGKTLALDPKAYIQNGTTMAPLRAIAEAMGYTVQWQGNHGIRVAMRNDALQLDATLRQQGSEYRLTCGAHNLTLSVAPVIKGGHTFVPLRPFAEAFDYLIAWDGVTRTVTLTNARSLPMLDGCAADTEFSLLADRLSLRAPAFAVDAISHVGGVMGSDLDERYESSLILQKNGQQMVVTAREIFSYSTGDLTRDFELFAGQRAQLYAISTPTRAGELEFVTYTALEYDEAQGGLVAGALVRAADKTLIRLTVSADRFAMAYPEQCAAMAGEILATVQAGTRLLETQRRTVALGKYQMTLESGYALTYSAGPDFDVSYFYKLVALDQPQSNFGVYLGNSPSYGDDAGAQSVPDEAFGKPIVWKLYATAPGMFNLDTYAETLIETGTQSWDSFLHVFATPVSAADWDAVRAMVRSLQQAPS